MTSDVDWFDVGWDAYKEGGRYPESFPPMNDMEAQRSWLGGFGAACVEAADDDESVKEALARVLTGREELLRQLRSHLIEGTAEQFATQRNAVPTFLKRGVNCGEYAGAYRVIRHSRDREEILRLAERADRVGDVTSVLFLERSGYQGAKGIGDRAILRSRR